MILSIRLQLGRTCTGQVAGWRSTDKVVKASETYRGFARILASVSGTRWSTCHWNILLFNLYKGIISVAILQR